MKKRLEARVTYWNRELEKSLRAKDDVFVLLGRIVHEGDFSGQIKHDDYALACESVLQLDSEVQTIYEESLKLEEQVEQLGDIQDRRKTLNKEYRTLKDRETALYEDLGHIAWESWKSGSYIGGDIEKALRDLIRAEERLHLAQDAVYRNEVPGRKSSLFNKGRVRLLSERHKMAATAMERLWIGAGRRIFMSIVLEKLSGSSMESCVVALRELKLKRTEIQDEIKSLEKQAKKMESSPSVDDNLSAEVATFPETKKTGGSLRRRVLDNEARLQKKRDSLDSSLQSLAELWLHLSEKDRASEIKQILESSQADDKSVTLDTGLSRAHADCQQISIRITLCRRNRDNLLSHKKCEDLKKVIKKEKNKIEKLKDKIKARQCQLSELEEKTTQIQKDLDNQLKNLPPPPERDD